MGYYKHVERQEPLKPGGEGGRRMNLRNRMKGCENMVFLAPLALPLTEAVVGAFTLGATTAFTVHCKNKK